MLNNPKTVIIAVLYHLIAFPQVVTAKALVSEKVTATSIHLSQLVGLSPDQVAARLSGLAGVLQHPPKVGRLHSAFGNVSIYYPWDLPAPKPELCDYSIAFPDGKDINFGALVFIDNHLSYAVPADRIQVGLSVGQVPLGDGVRAYLWQLNKGAVAESATIQGKCGGKNEAWVEEWFPESNSYASREYASLKIGLQLSRTHFGALARLRGIQIFPSSAENYYVVVFSSGAPLGAIKRNSSYQMAGVRNGRVEWLASGDLADTFKRSFLGN